MAEQRYKLNNHAGSFPQGMIVTEKQVRDAGFDFDFWQSTKTLSKATEDDAQVGGADALLDDAAMKAVIERRIREEGVTRKVDQDRIAIEVSRQWGQQRDERAEAQADELARTGGGQGKAGQQKPPPVGGANPSAEPKVAGRPLSDFDGKSDDDVKKLIPGNEAAKTALLKDVREAQRQRDGGR